MKEEREQRRRERQIRTGARGERSIWERNEREAYSVYNLYTGTYAQKVSQTKSTQESLINEDTCTQLSQLRIEKCTIIRLRLWTCTHLKRTLPAVEVTYIYRDGYKTTSEIRISL